MIDGMKTSVTRNQEEKGPHRQYIALDKIVKDEDPAKANISELFKERENVLRD